MNTSDAAIGGSTLSSEPAQHDAAPEASFYGPSTDSLQRDRNVGHLIKEVYASLNRSIDQNVAPLGLTAMQWRPLVMIRHKSINTPAELARHSGIDTGAMTRTLDRLEAKGFLTRHRCEQDRRVVILELTQEGHDIVDGILPAVADALNAHVRGFDTSEVVLLCDMLKRMIANGGHAEEDEPAARR